MPCAALLHLARVARSLQGWLLCRLAAIAEYLCRVRFICHAVMCSLLTELLRQLLAGL